MCELTVREEEIMEMSKEKWKNTVEERIHKVSIDKLNEERKKLKKGKDLSEYTVLQLQGYFEELTAKEARTFFKIRTEIFDLKCFRTYKYDDSICRLCKNGKVKYSIKDTHRNT
jgi:hypothetical protein